jgi:hypothetical protein
MEIIAPNALHTLANEFPWVRYLSDSEAQAFEQELRSAISDSREPDVDANPREVEVVTGWRATARIKADKSGYARALLETSGDFGPVDA